MRQSWWAPGTGLLLGGFQTGDPAPGNRLRGQPVSPPPFSIGDGGQVHREPPGKRWPLAEERQDHRMRLPCRRTTSESGGQEVCAGFLRTSRSAVGRRECPQAGYALVTLAARSISFGQTWVSGQLTAVRRPRVTPVAPYVPGGKVERSRSGKGGAAVLSVIMWSRSSRSAIRDRRKTRRTCTSTATSLPAMPSPGTV